MCDRRLLSRRKLGSDNVPQVALLFFHRSEIPGPIVDRSCDGQHSYGIEHAKLGRKRIHPCPTSAQNALVSKALPPLLIIMVRPRSQPFAIPQRARMGATTTSADRSRSNGCIEERSKSLCEETGGRRREDWFEDHDGDAASFSGYGWGVDGWEVEDGFPIAPEISATLLTLSIVEAKQFKGQVEEVEWTALNNYGRYLNSNFRLNSHQYKRISTVAQWL